jgi:hypothetical protein
MNNMQWFWFRELPPGKLSSWHKGKHISRHGMNGHSQIRIQQIKHLATMLGFEELVVPYVDKVFTLQTNGGV